MSSDEYSDMSPDVTRRRRRTSHRHRGTEEVNDDDSDTQPQYLPNTTSSNDNDDNMQDVEDEGNNAGYTEEEEDDDDDDEDHPSSLRNISSQEYYSEPNNSAMTNGEEEQEVEGSSSYNYARNSSTANSSSSVNSDLAAADSGNSPVDNSGSDTAASTTRGNPTTTSRATYRPNSPASNRGSTRIRSATRAASTGQSLSPTARTPSRSRRSGAMSGGRTTPITTPATGTAAAATMSASSASAPTAACKLINAVDSLELLYRCSRLREVAGTSVSNNEALSWQLSSAKPGNGVEQIRDVSIESYWQSDGVSQPHWIQIHFQRRLAISHVCLYLDYHLDESYTPKTITIEAGMTAQDLVCATSPIPKIEFHEPSGWCIIPLCAPPDPLDGAGYYEDDDHNNNLDDDDDDEDNINDRHEDDDDMSRGRKDDEIALEKHFQKPLLKAHMIRIAILSMHQNGRDTHVRRLALFARQQQQNRIIQQPAIPFHSLSNTAYVRDSTIPTAVQMSTDSAGRNVVRSVTNVDEEDGEHNMPPSEHWNENSNTAGQPIVNADSFQASSWYTESWNHRRNTAASDFTTIGRNSYSTIR
jgi:Anaphase-promoting complex, subunit 10 (APC10)